jgi:hypothetical protein
LRQLQPPPPGGFARGEGLIRFRRDRLRALGTGPEGTYPAIELFEELLPVGLGGPQRQRGFRSERAFAFADSRDGLRQGPLNRF